MARNPIGTSVFELTKDENVHIARGDANDGWDFHVIFEPIKRRRLVVRVLRIHTSSRLLGWFVWIPVVSDRFEMDYARVYGGFIPRHDLHVLSSR